MSANDRQVGGSHYGGGTQQHWDMVVQHELDYFQGQITKYVMRWKAKNGLQDLEKAQHFLEKYIEEVRAGRIDNPKSVLKVGGSPTLAPAGGLLVSQTALGESISDAQNRSFQAMREPISDAQNRSFQAMREPISDAQNRNFQAMRDLDPAFSVGAARAAGLQIEGWYGDGRMEYTQLSTRRRVQAHSVQEALKLLAATPAPPSA